MKSALFHAWAFDWRLLCASCNSIARCCRGCSAVLNRKDNIALVEWSGLIFAQRFPSERCSTEKMGEGLIKFAPTVVHMNQPDIPSSGVFVRSLERSRLRLISIRARRVIYKSRKGLNYLRHHRISLFSLFSLGRTEYIFALFSLYPILNYALCISEVTIVTKACFILIVYVQIIAFFPFIC